MSTNNWKPQKQWENKINQQNLKMIIKTNNTNFLKLKVWQTLDLLNQIK